MCTHEHIYTSEGDTVRPGMENSVFFVSSDQDAGHTGVSLTLMASFQRNHHLQIQSPSEVSEGEVRTSTYGFGGHSGLGCRRGCVSSEHSSGGRRGRRRSRLGRERTRHACLGKHEAAQGPAADCRHSPGETCQDPAPGTRRALTETALAFFPTGGMDLAHRNVLPWLFSGAARRA